MSVNDSNYQKAKKSGKHIAKNVVSHYSRNHDLVPVDVGARTASGRSVKVLAAPHHVESSLQLHRLAVFPMQPLLQSNSYVSGGSTRADLRLPRSGPKIENLRIRKRMAETGGSNTVTPSNMPWWDQKIEICPQNGSYVLQTYYPTQLWLYTALLSQEQFSTIASSMGTTSAWAGCTALAASAIRDFYLPLPGIFFESAGGLDLSALDSDLVVRFWTQPAVSAGSGTLAITALEGISNTIDHGELEHRDRKALKDQPVNYNFIDCVAINYSGTITASQPSNFSLRNLTGLCAALIVTIRASNSVASNGLSTFSAIENSTNNDGTIEIINELGQGEMAGGPIYYASDLKYNRWSEHFSSQLTQNSNVYVIPFVHNLTETLKTSKVDGGRYFDGSEVQVRFTPNASFSTGTHYIDFHCLLYKKAILSDGVIMPLE